MAISCARQIAAAQSISRFCHKSLTQLHGDGLVAVGQAQEARYRKGNTYNQSHASLKKKGQCMELGGMKPQGHNALARGCQQSAYNK